MTVSYMVKGDDLVLTSRLGTAGQKLEEDRTHYPVSSEWNYFEHTFNKMNDINIIEYIIYSTSAGKINIAELKVVVDTK